MPLEIRELIIKVNIERDVTQKPQYPIEEIDNLKKDVIRECTDAVLSRIKSITER